jgi:hypothetical protein
MTTIDEIRARWAKATPGPWRVAHHGTWEVEAPPNVLVADCGTIDRAKEDATAIAAAPSDIATLLDLLDAERARAERAEAEVERLAKERDALRTDRDLEKEERDRAWFGKKAAIERAESAESRLRTLEQAARHLVSTTEGYSLDPSTFACREALAAALEAGKDGGR